MKILIVYAYAGIGHKKAADAVEKALSAKAAPGLQVKNVDILDYTNAFFRFSYPRIYLFLINRIPTLWGFLYYLFDFRAVDFFTARLRRFLHKFNSKRFSDFVAAEAPDVIVSTHFMASEVISDLKQKGVFRGKLVTIVTDFLPHYFWVARNSDYFIGAIDRTRRELLRRGVDEKKIMVLGIPCDPVFGISKGRDALLRKMDIRGGFFNVLMMSGGFGTGPIREMVREINNIEPGVRDRLQVIVICGKNEKLFGELNRDSGYLKLKLRVFGYMNNVDEFMEISDVIITKAGGLTSTEALSKNIPMIIARPIPGQETRNCGILTGYGTAVRVNNPKEANRFLRDFINYPEKIRAMKTRVRLLAYPDSAGKIADFVISA
ncbi:MAG: glycosyltransferase [Candidatus Omnitrophota bacterium]